MSENKKFYNYVRSKFLFITNFLFDERRKRKENNPIHTHSQTHTQMAPKDTTTSISATSGISATVTSTSTPVNDKKKKQLTNTKQQRVRRADQEWTREEIAKHNNRESCWVIIDGLVYDLTRYLDRHPGGDVILNKVRSIIFFSFFFLFSSSFVIYPILRNYMMLVCEHCGM